MNRNNTLSALAIAAIVTIAAVPSVYAKSSKPALQKNGITVWKQAIPNTKIIGFKGNTTINATPKQILSVIMDIENSNQWIPRTRSAKSYEDQTQNGLPKTYIILDMPFPLADRELMVSSNITQQPNGTINMSNKLTTINGIKPNKKYVRIPSYSGSWVLKPVGKNKTDITITGHADPAGGLPAWVANLFVTDQPYEMLRNLKKQVQKPKYQNPTIKYVTIK